MKTNQKQKKLTEVQFDLINEIRAKANINIVSCGNCGTILLHELKPTNKDNKISCFGCMEEMELCDCPDYW